MLKEFFDNISTHIWSLKDQETYGLANNAHTRFFDHQESCIANKKISDVFKSGQAIINMNHNAEVFENKQSTQREEWIENANGEKRLLLINRIPKIGTDGKVDYVICYGEDITERRKMEEDIKYKAFHDSITKLYNRTFFDEAIERFNKDLSRFLPFSMIYIDLDGMKTINDIFGHEAGDQQLIKASEILSNAFRKTDIIARIGGDEFCILLPCVNEKLVARKTNKVIELIDQYNSQCPQIFMKMSIGFATSKATDMNLYDILNCADAVMYRQKTCKVTVMKDNLEDPLALCL